MKTVFIGDIHGRTTWKRIVRENKDADQVVIFGDYFDPYSFVPFEMQKSNFLQIVEFAQKGDHDVVLLLGNHDIHYFIDGVEPCSRFDEYNKFVIRDLFLDNIGMFDVVYAYSNVLCSHAGISPAWLLNYEKKFNPENIDLYVHDLFVDEPTAFAYEESDMSMIGNSVLQGPMWIRPSALIRANKQDQSITKDFVQVFGHTQVEDIVEATRVLEEETAGRFYMVDALDSKGYLVEENGVFTAINLEI